MLATRRAQSRVLEKLCGNFLGERPVALERCESMPRDLRFPRVPVPSGHEFWSRIPKRFHSLCLRKGVAVSSCFALLVAALGGNGVTSYSVARRTLEVREMR
jgi:hypothetical protein